MDTAKILEVVSLYREEFAKREIGKKRMDPSKSLGELSSIERLEHAHFLLDGIVEFSKKPGKEGKTGRHLASVQMILSFEKWFTLQDLMNQNRPDKKG